MKEWPQKHPTSFHLRSCLKPIMNADVIIEMEFFRIQMQKMGGFMLRVSENPDPSLWDLVFFCCPKFYCKVTMSSPEGLPEKVKNIFDEERAKMLSEQGNNLNLRDAKNRAKLIRERREYNILRGMDAQKASSLFEEEEDEEEEKLESEALRAKNAEFKLPGVTGHIIEFEFYVDDISVL